MHNDSARLDSGGRERCFESLDPLGLYRLFVAVEFWNRREELHCSHAGVRSTLDGHVYAAVVNRVGTEELGHYSERQQEACLISRASEAHTTVS